MTITTHHGTDLKTDAAPDPRAIPFHDDAALKADTMAFPTLDAQDIAAIRPLASECEFADGQTVFRAGDANLDLFVVEEGALDIRNPTDNDAHIVTHTPGQFSGDIDLLTRRPVIVDAVAVGRTRLLRVPGPRIRELLNKVPRLSEKLVIAIQERRRLVLLSGKIGLKIVGPGKCRDTQRVREFLFKNFVPFTWFDSEDAHGQALMQQWGSPRKSPVIQLNDGQRLLNPSLRELAQRVGVWRECPVGQVDLVVIGCGPAGMAAAVYAASEGIGTIVLDRLGPGGQAAGSSMIENFIGFPSGLSGAELATRGMLQMLKFGARIVAPINVDRIEPAAADNDCHTLHLDCGASVPAKVILIAAGVSWRKLDAPGADRFESAGIYYACTTVEATLYDAQDVAVIGAGNSAGQAAMFLADCCRDRTVHLLVRKKLGPGMSQYLVRRLRAASNVKVHENTEVAAVHGHQRLESVDLRTASSTEGIPPDAAAGQPTANLSVGAIFVFIGAEPGCDWLPDTIARDPLGYILTGPEAARSGRWPLADRPPVALETTIPGILAAGDIRCGSTKRVGFAVGDGSLAVTCTHILLANRK